MLVVENKWFVQLDKFFRADEVALRPGKRRLFHAERDGHAVDAGYDGFLSWNRKLLVALLRDGDGFELDLQPTVHALRRAVVLAVSQAGELDTAAHVDGIDGRSRELVHAGVAPRNHAGGNERHAAANHVHGNDVEALAFVRRKLAEVGAKQIGKRPRRVDALVPPDEGRTLRALDNRGTDDGDGEIAAAAREDGFAQAFREGVSVGPTEMLGAAHANANKPVARPARPVTFQNAVEFRGGRGSNVAAASKGLSAKRLRELRAFGAGLDAADGFAEGSHFALRVKIRTVRRVVVSLQLFGDAAVA